MKTFIKRTGLRKKIKKEKKSFSFSYQGRDQNTNLWTKRKELVEITGKKKKSSETISSSKLEPLMHFTWKRRLALGHVVYSWDPNYFYPNYSNFRINEVWLLFYILNYISNHSQPDFTSLILKWMAIAKITTLSFNNGLEYAHQS